MTASLGELKRTQNLLTLARVPLAVAFPFVARDALLGVTVLVLAGFTDVLDGWVARRARQASTLGQLLDPIADKIFAISVVATLVVQGRIPLWGIPLYLSREVVEAATIPLTFPERAEWQARLSGLTAGGLGKATTCTQFAVSIAALSLPDALVPALALSGAVGTVAGVSYFRRERARHRR